MNVTITEGYFKHSNYSTTVVLFLSRDGQLVCGADYSKLIHLKIVKQNLLVQALNRYDDKTATAQALIMDDGTSTTVTIGTKTDYYKLYIQGEYLIDIERYTVK